MEVHSHTHTPRKKWTHYFWEFFMLFLAITLGFFVENQREHFIESKRTKEYAYMFKRDLVSDTLLLKRFLDTKDSSTKEFDWLIRFYKTPKEEITFGQWDSMHNHSINLNFFKPSDATYSLLKSSGNLRYFLDTTLLSKISEYDSWNQASNEFRGMANSLYGGLSSNHQLRSNILSRQFLRKHKNTQPGILLKDAGYDFESWDESAAINVNYCRSLSIMYNHFYPQIKRVATELIILLNKKYHLN